MSKITPLYGDDAIERFKQLVEEAKSPTPSKEPSVDDLDEFFTEELRKQYQAGLDRKVTPDLHYEAVLARIKAQLLALHLGCLPDKRDTKEAETSSELLRTLRGNSDNVRAQKVGFNSAIDLMEQRLRALYE